MKRFGIAVCLFLMLALLCGLAVHADSAADTALVSYIYDGDTIRLADGRRIRLAGIDAPEKDPEQYWSRRSTAYLTDVLRRSDMRVSVTPVAEDRYGRIVAEVCDSSGKSINVSILRDGMAYYYPHQELSPELASRLLAAQRKALHERKGLWKGLLELRMAGEPYIGNRKSLRVFSQDCRDGFSIAKYNRVEFSSLEEAFEAGFAPARSCAIWPLQKNMRQSR